MRSIRRRVRAGQGSWGSRVLPLMLLFSLSVVACAHSATWVVDLSGGGDFVTVQEGVNAAGAGDTVLVHPGLYDQGRVEIHTGKDGMYLIGDGPPGSVVLTSDTAVIVAAQTDPPVHIEHLTITGSSALGGLVLNQARAEVRGCIFRGNNGPGSCHGVGGAVEAVMGSDLCLEDCIIENNTGWESPGGVIIWSSRADIRRNVFRGNSACYGGGLEMYHCDSEQVSYIEDNVFVDNEAATWGGGIFIVDSSPVVRRNTFYNNALPGDAAIWVLGGKPSLTQNVIVGSAWGICCQVESGYPAPLPVADCNLFYNLRLSTSAGECPDLGTVIEANPLFCDEAGGEFSLCANSPALSESCGRLGAFGEGCPSCGDDLNPVSWGTIKILFR